MHTPKEGRTRTYHKILWLCFMKNSFQFTISMKNFCTTSRCIHWSNGLLVDQYCIYTWSSNLGFRNLTANKKKENKKTFNHGGTRSWSNCKPVAIFQTDNIPQTLPLLEYFLIRLLDPEHQCFLPLLSLQSIAMHHQ